MDFELDDLLDLDVVEEELEEPALKLAFAPADTLLAIGEALLAASPLPALAACLAVSPIPVVLALLSVDPLALAEPSDVFVFAASPPFALPDALLAVLVAELTAEFAALCVAETALLAVSVAPLVSALAPTLPFTDPPIEVTAPLDLTTALLDWPLIVWLGPEEADCGAAALLGFVRVACTAEFAFTLCLKRSPSIVPAALAPKPPIVPPRPAPPPSSWAMHGVALITRPATRTGTRPIFEVIIVSSPGLIADARAR